MLSTIATSLLIFLYARRFLTPAASLVCGLCFLTTGQVMELGRLGETEAMYTLIVSGSMLLRHRGDRDGWHPAISWGIGYSLVAFAMLAKGSQGPANFIFPIWS